MILWNFQILLCKCFNNFKLFLNLGSWDKELQSFQTFKGFKYFLLLLKWQFLQLLYKYMYVYCIYTWIYIYIFDIGISETVKLSLSQYFWHACMKCNLINVEKMRMIWICIVNSYTYIYIYIYIFCKHMYILYVCMYYLLTHCRIIKRNLSIIFAPVPLK